MKKLLALLLSLALTLTSINIFAANDFEDELNSKKEITNEKAILMIIESLGYNELITQLTYLKSPFLDVIKNKHYIAMASDFGIISQTQNKLFNPNDLLTREDAAVMLINTYDKLNNKLNFINGYYAICSLNQTLYQRVKN